MAVEQDDFRYLMPGKLPGSTQTKHVFGVFPLALITDLCLASKERLKAFTLQAFENGDGRDVGISAT